MCSYASWPGSNTAKFLRSDSTGSISRSESLGYMEHTCLMMEKRQLFLRSYQFSRKRSLMEQIRRSFAKAKRFICFRLRSEAKFRKEVSSRLSRFRQRVCTRRRRPRFLLSILDGCSGFQSQGGRNSCSCLC